MAGAELKLGRRWRALSRPSCCSSPARDAAVDEARWRLAREEVSPPPRRAPVGGPRGGEAGCGGEAGRGGCARRQAWAWPARAATRGRRDRRRTRGVARGGMGQGLLHAAEAHMVASPSSPRRARRLLRSKAPPGGQIRPPPLPCPSLPLCFSWRTRGGWPTAMSPSGAQPRR